MNLTRTVGDYNRLINFRCLPSLFQKCNYAKKIEAAGGIASLGKKKGKLSKLGPVMEKKILPVETDPHKLVNFVCGTNLLKEGGEDIKLKADNEYPDWLWTLRIGKSPRLEEMDPNTWEYWRRIRKMGMRRNNLLSKLKKF
ncbi:39S ribosomal protein L54 [Blattella germanica]|nr:39S ribosomal protein L54 [Blattella germanica]